MKELEDNVNSQRELIETLRDVIADLEIRRLDAEGLRKDSWPKEDDLPTPTTSQSARAASKDMTENVAPVSSGILCWSCPRILISRLTKDNTPRGRGRALGDGHVVEFQ